MANKIPSKKRWYIISYDVREPKRLHKVAKHLEGYGERMQYSLFRCRLTERQLERLRWELTKILKPEDALLVIGLCQHCAARVHSKGGQQDWVEKPPTFEII